MKKIFVPIIALAIPNLLIAQAPVDRKVIDNFCGCFDVDFKYAETFAPSGEYKYHERDETPAGTELSLPIEQTDKRVVIQHLLVINDSVIVKHWREEWSYENPVIWKYTGDRTWVKQLLKAEQVKGKWTQSIWEVSDEPRYQGFSQFVNMDNKLIWQSTADAPLPRREYAVRNDYNVLKRTNRMNITDSGYVHEQDNVKILRSNGKDEVLVEEKGLNTYKRIDNRLCSPALKFWEKNHVYWDKVRQAWENYIASSNVIKLKFKVEGKLLHDYLYALNKEYNSKKVAEADIDKRIKAEMEKFVIGDDHAAVK
ncbi:MAG: hypothetical protein H7Y86_04935 [Rhizobacter sp.]|nr:hypothetical protein [Ferruginibacter sp.]